jgi:hypothetical protein
VNADRDGGAGGVAGGPALLGSAAGRGFDQAAEPRRLAGVDFAIRQVPASCSALAEGTACLAQLRNGDIVLRQLQDSRSWQVLAPMVAAGPVRAQWPAGGSRYAGFAARPGPGASTVAFVAYQPEGEHAIRFRGALVREPDGAVLVKVRCR